MEPDNGDFIMRCGCITLGFIAGLALTVLLIAIIVAL